MNGQQQRWYPSRRKQAFEWYMRIGLRLMGAGTFAWEILADKGRNLVVLLAATMLASSMNVLDLVRGLIAQAKAERMSLEELVEQERRREEKEQR